MKFTIKKYYHDVLIVGSGGAGLSAAIFAKEKDNNINIAVISKSDPLENNTISAQGGINASLGNIKKDNWLWHSYDTIKAGAGLCDQDSVEYMCKNAPEIIYMLDELGVEFDKLNNGKINQKIYGGQTTEFGKGELAYRACFSKDKTGHTIMHKLYDHVISKNVKFYTYNFALDLIVRGELCYGVLCWDIKKGVLNVILAKNVIIATGGYSQIYAATTSSEFCSGDGIGLISRAGCLLQDMEFVQFHPTSLHKKNILITEAARSAGGKLLNSKNERFMFNYAPNFKELAARDVVASAMFQEIKEGRGCGKNKDHILLDLTHLSENYIKNNLPTIFENTQKFANINPAKEPIPVVPAAHYSMGGIATDFDCKVIKQCEQNCGKLCGYNCGKKVENLFSIGEAANISVHGAARLGCNSLLDLIIFAKKVAQNLSITNNKINFNQVENLIENKINKFKQSFAENSGRTKYDQLINNNIRKIMSDNVGVSRSGKNLEDALAFINQHINKYSNMYVFNKSLKDNLELKQYLETENILICAKATTESALFRKESRGAHWRSDYKDENEEFKSHTIYYYQDNLIKLKSVRLSEKNMQFYQLKKRIY